MPTPPKAKPKPKPVETMVFNACDFAPAWAGVDIATSKDKARPILTGVLIEWYRDKGVRLVATDSYMLLHAWVAMGNSLSPKAKPDRVVVARDSADRASSLIAFAMKATGDSPDLTISVTLGMPALDQDKATPRFDGMEGEAVIFEVPDQERVVCDIIEGEPGFPDWRGLVKKSQSTAVIDAIGINTDFMAKVGKLGKLFDMRAVKYHFTGSLSPATFRCGPVEGLLMPVRMED